jgi:uncharacterized protein YbjQ (UPF0145 family)
LIVVTTPTITEKRVLKTFGMVRGGTVRGKHAGKDLIAWLRNLVGGEINEYTKMLAESREQALDRMMQDAKKLGANAILGTRYSTSDIASGAAEIVVYGTAVLVKDKEPGQESAD